MIRAYAKSLALYPRRFRGDFGEEMQAVFNLRVQAAAGDGFGGLAWLAFRELIDLPRTLLALHARERRLSHMQKRMDRWFIHEPGAWQELLLACLPFLTLFLLTGIFSFSGMEDRIPAPVGLGLFGLAVLALVVLGIAGLLVRLPRWAMPYGGVLFTGVVFLAMILCGASSWLFGRSSAPWLLRMATFDLLSLFALVIAMLVLILLAQRFSLTRAFAEQVRKDWSTFSFAMYGGAMVLVLGMYEDVSGAGLYLLLTVIPLLLGVWAFLRTQAVGWRIASLCAAVTVGMGIALIANLQLMDWTPMVEFSIGSLEVTRTILSIILSWLLSLAMLFIPMLLPLLPFPGSGREQMA
jgi:hypothetical protein